MKAFERENLLKKTFLNVHCFFGICFSTVTHVMLHKSLHQFL